MKKAILAISVVLSLLITTGVNADQRFESWQGICHFAYDANDADNEVYFGNCKNTIDTYDAGDGQGRLAKGTTRATAFYNSIDKTYNSIMVDGVIRLRGVDANNETYPDNLYTVANTGCVMVTSNYNAGADDNNETVYNTNDWNLEIIADTDNVEKSGDNYIVPFKYNMACRNGIVQ